MGWLYLIEILHQTTTLTSSKIATASCILSKFYIKPQLVWGSIRRSSSCILSKFYIKPQLVWGSIRRSSSCILSKFYIKPQLVRNYYSYSQVVSYRNSTSNHNIWIFFNFGEMLYLIEILHQTTTSYANWQKQFELYLIEILHQTTTSRLASIRLYCCILSKFYIKPQRRQSL